MVLERNSTLKRIVIHTADWHLGKNRKYNDYLDQQRYMLEAILAIVRETIADNPDAEIWLIVAGDIFDRNEDTDREEFILPILYILYPLLELEQQHLNFSFHFIDGNHDRQPYDPTDPNSLASVVSPLVQMAGKDKIAVVEPKWIEDKKLLLVPFGQHTVNSLHSLLKEYPSQFMVIHECCAGITTDVGWKPPRDQDHYIDIGELLDGAPNLDAVFMGDIHRSQPLDSDGICYYAGSPITLDHGHKMPKGVLIHEFVLTEGRWKQQKEPELRCLTKYNPNLRTHIQLGIIETIEEIPYQILDKKDHFYLKMTISADVYATIIQKYPDIFTSPYVTWDYKSENIIRELPEEKKAEDDQTEYYKPLITQWVVDNGKELTTEEKKQVIELLVKDFETRG
jgi:DNA repair exonuclease SbcCD nuclease subunit